jgi:polar amino acid transport system substrate-binding protein
MATMIMLSGISAFSIITANLASEFSLENTISNISSLNDLKGIRTGTKSGTTSENLLQNNGAVVVGFDEIEQAMEALTTGKIEAIVFDEPVIRWLAKENPEKTCITGEMFALQNYGIALRKGDKLRKQINLALLKLQENGTYNEIYNRWFNNP